MNANGQFMTFPGDDVYLASNSAWVVLIDLLTSRTRGA